MSFCNLALVALFLTEKHTVKAYGIQLVVRNKNKAHCINLPRVPQLITTVWMVSTSDFFFSLTALESRTPRIIAQDLPGLAFYPWHIDSHPCCVLI